MTEQLANATVGEIVATDFRAAGVFERFGIDFCCGGHRPLVDACRDAAADPKEVVTALERLPPATDDDANVTHWRLDRLIDHIVSTHHRYVQAVLPTIARYLARLHQVYGARHPELARVVDHFDRLSRDLEQHLLKEEQVLFPYVRDLEMAPAVPGPFRSPFGTVENPIRMIEREHRDVADELQTIRELTNGYAVPEDGCSTYAVCMAELARFERDLHRHVHLENNVLFPRALDLEAARWRS